MNFKPMLSGKAPDDLTKLKYPVAVSPKLDGFRAIVIDGVVMSRNLKPIRNEYVQEVLGLYEYNGFDGELIVGDPTSKSCFRDTSSGVTSRDGEPDVKFYVFDNCFETDSWVGRFGTIPVDNEMIIRVPHELAFDADQLIECEERYLEQGYEGLMIRDPNGSYKEGRSTTREGWLLKLKRFEDSEALVIGMEEKGHNANEATTNLLGHTERSSHKENIIGMNTMGALIVRDLKSNIEFNVGTGFDDAERMRWWLMSLNWPEQINSDNTRIRMCPTVFGGVIVKYKFFNSGSKNKPRFPTYLGVRSQDDFS